MDGQECIGAIIDMNPVAWFSMESHLCRAPYDHVRPLSPGATTSKPFSSDRPETKQRDILEKAQNHVHLKKKARLIYEQPCHLKRNGQFN